MSIMLLSTFSIVVIWSTVFAVKADAEADRCLTLLKPETMMLECCNGIELSSEDNDCTSNGPATPANVSCEVEECLMKKLSLLNPDGTVNEATSLDLLNKISEEQPINKPAVERIVQKCLKGQYKKYGPKPICESSKYIACGYIHGTLECSEWKGSEECDDIKEIANSCKTFFDNAFDKLLLE